jgi:hypothetical protein
LHLVEVDFHKSFFDAQTKSPLSFVRFSGP